VPRERRARVELVQARQVALRAGGARAHDGARLASVAVTYHLPRRAARLQASATVRPSTIRSAAAAAVTATAAAVTKCTAITAAELTTQA